jgi:signal transduction histidine kinase
VEAVTNVARHAGVACATADFAILTGPMLGIEVHNHGQAASTWEPGVGLQSMRERVEQIGGTISIDTGPSGSTVTAQIPLKFPS